MTKGTRYFVVGAVLVMAGVLCTGLVAYYSGGLKIFAAKAGPDQLTYVPADASIVGYANVGEVMRSEFRQKLRQVLPSGDARDEFQKETGIDIERDVTDVVASITGDQATVSGGLVLVRGTFSQSNIEALCLQHGATIEDYKGKRLVNMRHEMPAAGGANAAGDMHQGGLSFVESNLVAVGELGNVKKAIDAHASGQNVTASKEMMGLVEAEGTSNSAWVVGRFDTLAKTTSLPDQVKNQLPSVQFFAVSARIDGGVTGNVRVDARDDPAAENLRDVVRGVLALAHLQAGKDSKLDGMINSLQLTGTGKTVQLSFAVPSEILEGLNGIAGLMNLNKPSAPTPKIK